MVRILSWLTVIALFLPGTQAQTPPTQPRAQNIHTERYRIKVNFFPEKGFLHATARITISGAKCPGAIELELNPRLTILEIKDGLNHNLEFDRSRSVGSPKVAVRLVNPCDPGSNTTLTLTYDGVLAPTPLDYMTKDGILLRDESRWYPAVDFSAFTQNDITLRLPTDWTGIATGSVDSTLDRKDHRWVTDHPVSSRAIVAVPRTNSCGPFLGGSPFSSSPPLHFDVRTCFSPPHNVNAYPVATSASQILQFYAELIGPNSSGIDLVQGFPGQHGVIGYSAPGFLVVSEDFVKHAGEKDYAPEFLPHEIAHQWFPIEVTLAREEDGWLAESLAEYLAWRYLEAKSPDQARRMVARAMHDAFVPQPIRPLSRGLKLFGEEGWEVTHTTLYDRGMLVWRTLETVIDRERVDRALREYYKRYAGRSASIADFRKICEEISGRNLGWFFDYFINGTELPEIELRRVPSSVPSEMAGEIRMKNVPPEFEVRVELLIDTARGPVNYSVATRGEVTPFTVTVPGPVLNVVLDPNSRMLRWTEALRRNQRQQALLLGVAQMESSGNLPGAIARTRQALTEDPLNFARNEKRIRFHLGRLLYRQGQFSAAYEEFERALLFDSYDPLEEAFHHAWAHLYRARILRRRGNLAGARGEANAGLAQYDPALEIPAPWGEPAGQMTTAMKELRKILASLPK